MGFTAVARHRSKHVLHYRQGDVDFILNMEPGGQAAEFRGQHGPSINAMAFRVRDAAVALRLALNLVHRAEDARDIYQEAFMRVYKNLHRFRFECSFYTWLYRIVTNVALDHLRRRTSRKEDQAPVPEDSESTTRDFFDRQPEARAAANPERNLLGQELGEHIATALNRLSPRERMVFEMKHYQGLKLRAIGDMLGTSEETVKNSLFRATRKLRASLECMR